MSEHKCKVYLANQGRSWVAECATCAAQDGYLWTGSTTFRSWQNAVNTAIRHVHYHWFEENGS